ncbi:MAG: class I SAM-dependent methyltransferase [Stenotrophomonas sp.]
MTLYERIAQLHGHRPWGSVLDAGTGPASMQWLQGLHSQRWTAVTGAAQMEEKTRSTMTAPPREQDRLLVGNWMDPTLLQGECFDVVLADYLLGAIEGFAPYWQGRLFERLRPLVGQRLYMIGLQPYIHGRPDGAAGAMVNAIGRLRDACLLLCGDSPYREYPLQWALRSLEAARFRVIDAQQVPITYGPRFIQSQLAMCSHAAGKLADRRLAVELLRHVDDLQMRALALSQQLGGLQHGHDYIIVAEPC